MSNLEPELSEKEKRKIANKKYYNKKKAFFLKNNTEQSTPELKKQITAAQVEPQKTATSWTTMILTVGGTLWTILPVIAHGYQRYIYHLRKNAQNTEQPFSLGQSLQQSSTSPQNSYF